MSKKPTPSGREQQLRAYASELKRMGPILMKEISVSSVMGVATGAATRRLARDAVYGAGLCLAGIQCLAYLGFITIHWTAVQAAVKDVVDKHKGKCNKEAVTAYVNRAMQFVARGIPDISGFSSGFYIGYSYLG